MRLEVILGLVMRLLWRVDRHERKTVEMNLRSLITRTGVIEWGVGGWCICKRRMEEAAFSGVGRRIVVCSSIPKAFLEIPLFCM